MNTMPQLLFGLTLTPRAIADAEEGLFTENDPFN